MTDSEFQTIAHRGASGYRPENTMCAFQHAWDLGITHIECDLRYTRDQRIVILHDSKVDRTTNGSGQLNEFDFDDLRRLDAGRWFGTEYAGEQIPSLGELFEESPINSQFTLEMKDPDILHFVDDVIEQVHNYEVEDRVIFSSFNLECLARINVVAPQFTTAALLDFDNSISDDDGRYLVEALSSFGPGTSQDSLLGNLKSLEVTFACPPARFISRQSVELLHDADLKIRAWGLNKNCDVHEMRNLIMCGVDGMTTNFPDILHRVHCHYGKGY